jgi:hypothetical protein
VIGGSPGEERRDIQAVPYLSSYLSWQDDGARQAYDIGLHIDKPSLQVRATINNREFLRQKEAVLNSCA